MTHQIGLRAIFGRNCKGRCRRFIFRLEEKWFYRFWNRYKNIGRKLGLGFNLCDLLWRASSLWPWIQRFARIVGLGLGLDDLSRGHKIFSDASFKGVELQLFYHR